MVHTLGIAGVKAIKSPDQIRTVLGSCIGIALFDLKTCVGGMAHIMLPKTNGNTKTPGKFADTGVDELLRVVLAEGAGRTRVQAKIAGGATMFGSEKRDGIGERNAEAVIDRLKHHKIQLAAQDVGGGKGRRMFLDPNTGDVQVQVIGEDPRTI